MARNSFFDAPYVVRLFILGEPVSFNTKRYGKLSFDFWQVYFVSLVGYAFYHRQEIRRWCYEDFYRRLL